MKVRLVYHLIGETRGRRLAVGVKNSFAAGKRSKTFYYACFLWVIPTQ